MKDVFNKLMIVISLFCLQTVGICQEKNKEDLEKKIEEMQKQMQDMQKELNELKRELLEQKVAEIAKEKKGEKSKGFSLNPVWDGGFWLKSEDGNFKMRIGGYIQSDARFFATSGYPNADTFLIRRVRPEIMGTVYKYFEYEFRADFANDATVLADAFLNFKASPAIQFKVGKMKPFFSLEQLQSDKYVDAIERSLAFNLSPDRDVGAMFHGELFEGYLNYGLGIFNGTTSLGGSQNRATQSDKDYFARFWLTPFKENPNKWLSGLQLGIATSYAEQDNVALDGRTFVTGPQTAFFTFANPTGGADVEADGVRWRLSPQLAYLVGPFGLKAEYNHSSAHIRGPAIDVGKYDFDAGYISLSYLLTGEKATLGKKEPLSPFDLDKGTWGAFEVATQYQFFKADDALITNGIGTATSSSKARAFVLGLNWYPVKDVRFSLNYERTDFSDDVTVSGETFDHEDAIMFRFQLEF